MFKEIERTLPMHLYECLKKRALQWEKLQEIRLRVHQPLLLRYDNKEVEIRDENGIVKITEQDIRECMEGVSSHSLYAYEEELRQGYITIEGGHRIGIVGKVNVRNHHIHTMRHISSINIRLSHQVKGCAKEVMAYLRHRDTNQNGWYSTLIVSPPGCGKTTLLRDIIRRLSDGQMPDAPGVTVGVVDERSEIGACYRGVPQHDIGRRTDILDCCPKAEGMMLLLRAMSPQVVAVDEIGERSDVEAIQYIHNCGCVLMATVHGSTFEEVKERPYIGQLIREHIFERYIILNHQGGPGHIQEVVDERGRVL